MHQEQRQRATDLLRSKGIQCALFSHLDSVKWLTGFAPPIQLGGNYFAGGPPLVWYNDGHFALILLDGQAADSTAFVEPPDIPILSYEGYTIQQPIQSAHNLAYVLQNLLTKIGKPSLQLGIEIETLPAYLAETVTQSLPNAHRNLIDRWLVPLRMVKTAEELHVLRQNFAFTDLGHKTAKQTVRPGTREIDVWMAVHSAINQAAGFRVPLGNDCVVGYREGNNIGGWPLDYELKNDTALIVDLSTIWHGYWSDSCATYYAGDMTQKQAAMHKVARDALDYGASLLRPGAVSGEIDQKIRQFIADTGYPVYPHHTGHGVGVSPHEEPRIVPQNNIPLQAGMVIMLEPGIYFPGETGVRLEDAFLITADGSNKLTTHLDT